ncbi:MAG: class I SAM-dependent methyltransferase, partial [Promethearchaeota archaeon]
KDNFFVYLMKEVSNCPICNSEKFMRLKEYSFTFPGGEVENHLMDANYTRLWIFFEKILKVRKNFSFFIILCQNCGFIFLNPRFTENEMKIKYETINELESVKYRLGKIPEFNLEKRANRVYKLINKFYKHESRDKPKILDYGGASGYILKIFLNGFECAILDYQKWDLNKDVKYRGKTLEDLNDFEKFDVILILHTLEHVINPKKFIQSIITHLTEHGILYIEIPLGCFYEWENLKNPLTHINFFSEESIYKCFDVCGLNILHINTSVQWVTRGKMLCLNIIGTKSLSEKGVPISRILSTKAQMSKMNTYYYYLLTVISQITQSKLNKIKYFIKNIKLASIF